MKNNLQEQLHRIKEMMNISEDFDGLSDKIHPYSKFESAEELLYSVRDRLANAVQMQEWSLVEEVTSDVFNFVKNKMESENKDRDIPGFEGTQDALDDLTIRK